jgi:hypothetical protein
MTRGTRLGLLGAALVVVIAAIVIAVSGGSDDKTDKSKPAAPAKPTVTQIRVVNAKPVGGIAKIDVKKGDRVRFTVVSDVGDEIHVHGYDFMKDVQAGGRISFNFLANITGTFEIELENRKEQIARLKVEP